jgi:hypothetical protein
MSCKLASLVQAKCNISFTWCLCKWLCTAEFLFQASRHVGDLFEDLRDGHNLISLLEVLSGEHLVSWFYFLIYKCGDVIPSQLMFGCRWYALLLARTVSTQLALCGVESGALDVTGRRLIAMAGRL